MHEQSGTIICSDGLPLSAVWRVPAGCRAVALILQGSGNVGADGDVSSPFLGGPIGNKPARLSEQLADALEAAGFATLRYSKRGVERASELGHQTFEYLRADASCALLAARERFPRLPLFVAGFSEGALLAALIARRNDALSGLFLLGAPLSPIDELLAYQFRDWPLSRLKLLSDGGDELGPSELEGIDAEGGLPFLGDGLAGLASSALTGGTRRSVSIQSDLKPRYDRALAQVLAWMGQAPYQPWYESAKALPPFERIASEIHVPVHAYYGADDAQFDTRGAERSMGAFPRMTSFRVYPGLGHCFSPMKGCAGQIKTSGPLSARVIEDLAADARSALSQVHMSQKQSQELRNALDAHP